MAIGIEVEGAREIEDRTREIVARMVGVSTMVRVTTSLRIRNLRRYDNNAGPDGRFWKRLAPSTIEQKQRLGGFSPAGLPKLVRTGRLRASFVTRARAVRGGSEGAVGTDVPYAVFHQFGTSRMPKREPLGVAQEDVKIVRRIMCQVFEATRDGREGV